MEENIKYPEKLSEIKPEVPFRVPDHYFDDFYSRLETRLAAEPSAKKEIRIYHYLRPALTIAAALALIALMLFWPLKLFVPGNMAKSEKTNGDFFEEDYYSMVSNLDEKSFYTLLDEPVKNENLTADDLSNFVNTTLTDYDIYIETTRNLK